MGHEYLCVTLVPLFNHLELDDQKKINEITEHIIVNKGETIFSPYSDSKLIIVAKGNMKVYQLSPNGKEQLLRIVEPGGYEGENQLFGAKNDVLFGEALEKTELCILRQENFQDILLKHPQLSLKLLEINAQKSILVEQQTQFLMMKKVEERLATYLINLSNSHKSCKFDLPLLMKELATFIGTTQETLSRKFRLLEDDGLIIRNNRTITIIDSDALEDLIEC
ncbi:CRP/FNR family transcriptional regulator, anaerobic regulatory protein [Vagococcus lutrae LBD1]|uniref:CRP/FNR family transcriptional regulator, anaerobic regulatory protein n=1 Tax=Vagococcus lutrae LBD1 TaxID=1408226 RepID=V6Q5F0_9ENTE|nr:Crp/Fnr family transcriptional regulator [Vagococcus lutrae]EST89880.1 CRP/FNR family transcriptional regulator, anaerobic regulatory protein [Vagococcus lutrae LBD1]